MIHLVMAFLVAGLFMTVSCQKKQIAPATTVENQPATSTTGSSGTTGSGSGSGSGTSSSGGGSDAGISEAELAAAKAAAAERRFGNQDIHFKYDSAELSSMAKMVLKDKAAWMKANPTKYVSVEGHCDERGTTEYNLALGELRAKAAKNYLVNLGIASSRLSTISYGEERPLDTASNESAWKKNRRAHFVIQ